METVLFIFEFFTLAIGLGGLGLGLSNRLHRERQDEGILAAHKNHAQHKEHLKSITDEVGELTKHRKANLELIKSKRTNPLL